MCLDKNNLNDGTIFSEEGLAFKLVKVLLYLTAIYWNFSVRFEVFIKFYKVNQITGIYILALPPPPWGVGEIFFKLDNREEYDGGLEKRKGKGGKRRKKTIKHALKYLYEA